METKTLAYPHWNDLVFENRNKLYGAYVLRKSYNEKVIAGLCLSNAIIFTLFFCTAISGDTKVKAFVKPLEQEHVIEVSPPPVFPKHPSPPTNTSPRTQPVKKDLPPLITHEPVAQTPDVAPVIPVTSTDVGTGIHDSFTAHQVGSTNVQIITIPARTVVNGAEVMPVYEGGIPAMVTFLKKNLKYPPPARRQGIEGTVTVSFVVNGDGSISDVEILKGFDPLCDHEAIRVVSSMKKWIGGRQNKLPVNVRMALPITFKLNGAP
jgi:periplasmic protein TonB